MYNPSRAASTDDPERFGEHGLIQIFGGEVDWEIRLQAEMEDKRGELLIMGEFTPWSRWKHAKRFIVSAQRHIREKIRRFVRQNSSGRIELFESEFQPWMAGKKPWIL